MSTYSWTYCAMSTTALIGLALIIYFVFEAVFAPKTIKTIDETLWTSLIAFGRLVSKSYDESPPHQISEIKEKGWVFRLVAREHSFRVWLWKVEEKPDPSSSNPTFGFGSADLVVVIRGTHTAGDWLYRNFKLISGMFGDHSEYYKMIAEEYLGPINELLKNNELNGKRFVFCGHSLGASVAEALHGKISHDSTGSVLWGNNVSIGSITFDSPGQPESYRLDPQNGMTEPLATSVIVNARPNIVNMLNSPIAAHFYACGCGSEASVEDILGKLIEFPAELYKGLIGLVKGAAGLISHEDRSHSMDAIYKHILNRTYRKEQRSTWPLLSRTVLTRLFARSETVNTAPVPPSSPSAVRPHVYVMLPTRPPPLSETPEMRDENNSSADDIKHEIPKSLFDIQQGKLYVWTTHTEAKTLFEKADPKLHLIIPLIGETNAGKTTTLAKLVFPEQDAYNENCAFYGLVQNDVNTTKFPMIMLWKVVNKQDGNTLRVYVVDMPGLCEGYAGLSEGSFYFGVGWLQGSKKPDFYTLCDPFRPLLLRAFIIQREVMGSAIRSHFDSLKKLHQNNVSIMVCQNAHPKELKSHGSNKEARKNMKDALTAAGVVHTLISFSARSSKNDNIATAGSNHSPDDFHCIEELEEHINQTIEEHHQRHAPVQDSPTAPASSMAVNIVKGALPFVPVLGPVVALVDDVRNKNVVNGAINATFLGLDIVTWGWFTPVATNGLKFLVKAAAGQSVKKILSTTVIKGGVQGVKAVAQGIAGKFTPPTNPTAETAAPPQTRQD